MAEIVIKGVILAPRPLPRAFSFLPNCMWGRGAWGNTPCTRAILDSLQLSCSRRVKGGHQAAFVVLGWGWGATMVWFGKTVQKESGMLAIHAHLVVMRLAVW